MPMKRSRSRLCSNLTNKLLGLCAVLLSIASTTPNAFAQGSPTIIWKRTQNADRVNAVIFNRSGDTLISGSSDRLINFWRVSDGTLIKTLNSAAPSVHESAIESLSITPDGTKLASASYRVVKLWTLPAGTERDITGHTDWVVGVAFSPNGQYVASASFDNTVKVWRVSDGGLVKTFTVSRQMRCVAFSPDGSLLAGAGGEGNIHLWRTSDWAQVRLLQGHTDDIYALEFSADGSRIGSGGYDHTARIWSTSTGAQLHKFTGNGNVYGVAFSPDGGAFAFTDGEGNTVRIHQVSDGALLKMYTQEVPQVQCVAYSASGLLGYGRVDKTVVLASTGGTPPPPPPPPPGDQTYTLTLDVSGYGTVQCNPYSANGSYREGTVIQIKATPDGNNSFLGWGGDASGKQTTISITMDGDKAIDASFSTTSKTAEILWQNNQRALAAWFLQGSAYDGSIQLRNGQPVASGWRLVSAADFNGDSQQDLLFQHQNGNMAIWLMNGNNVVQSVSVRNGQSSGRAWVAVGTGDFNGDGDPDILFQNGQYLATWLMSGTDFITSVRLRDGQPAGWGWQVADVADFNGDGDADVLFQHFDGRLAVWLMNGTDILRSVVLRDGMPPTSGWQAVAAGDIDSDGKNDILFQQSDGRLMVWYLNGLNYRSTGLLRDGQPAAGGWQVSAFKRK